MADGDWTLTNVKLASNSAFQADLRKAIGAFEWTREVGEKIAERACQISGIPGGYEYVETRSTNRAHGKVQPTSPRAIRKDQKDLIILRAIQAARQ